MRTRVRWWRWRHNELRRRSDVVEAWTVLVFGAVLALGVPAAGLTAGISTYPKARAEAAAQAAARHPVQAELTRDATALPPAVHGAGAVKRHLVPVRWSDADGVVRHGTALVSAGAHRGDHTQIWLDARDRVVPAPMNTADVWSRTLTNATTTSGSLTVLVCGTYVVVRRIAQRHRMAEWDREWARTGPEWRQRKS
ncbi:Rv1733c family protein [Actinomycetota bacterium Odt1-20B]